MKDWIKRALKTFVQAFFATFVIQCGSMLTNITSAGWDQWETYVTPVAIACLSAGISAVWNLILEYQKKQEAKAEENKDGVK